MTSYFVVRDGGDRLRPFSGCVQSGDEVHCGAAGISTVLVDTGDRDDWVVLAGGVPARAKFYGGAGNDTLTGGVGNDALYGEAGSDTLDGGPGWDGCDSRTEATNCEVLFVRPGRPPGS
jgi:Ca2+-binding RTX toxin-like protein